MARDGKKPQTDFRSVGSFPHDLGGGASWLATRWTIEALTKSHLNATLKTTQNVRSYVKAMSERTANRRIHHSWAGSSGISAALR